jgi:polyhydroxybutyrate depolymerase
MAADGAVITTAERHGTFPDRTVVAGLSNDAFMSHRLAIEAIEGGYSRHLGPNGELRGRVLSLDETTGFWRAAEEICRFAQPLLRPAGDRRR